jgi:hypothetical protein
MQKPSTFSMIPSYGTLTELQLQIVINRLESENRIMRKLSTREGFHKYYYSQLKNYKTKNEAFDYVNKQYQSLFGRFRYSDFNSFHQISLYYGN